MSFQKKCCFLVPAAALVAALVWTAAAAGEKPAKILPPYQDPNLPVELRVQDLLGRMTLEEKIAQVQCSTADVEAPGGLGPDGLGGLAVVLRDETARTGAEKANRIMKLALTKTRLGIPLIIHDEALHGILARGGSVFPQAIGLAATWNPDLVERVARAIGREARTRGIRQVLSPVVNIARDVRWGRTEETYGEDPFLTSAMGVAFCRGVEGQGVITTPKHYAANVGDGGRDSQAVHFSERLLREVYFPAFKACVQSGGANSVMAAYNSLNGIPCSADPWLLTDVLKNEWGFQGFVVSDYGSVNGVWSKHATAATKKEAAVQALEAGLDMELPGVDVYGKPLLEALQEGLVSEAVLDRAVARILSAKFRLGLFDKPYVDPAEAARVNDSPEHRALALEAARQSIVLLKNDNGLLPLPKNLKTIAVLGPCADDVRLGGYSGFGVKLVSVLEGIKNRASAGTKVVYAKGCELETSSLPVIPEANFAPAGGPDGAHGLKAEYFNNPLLEGAPALVRVDPAINFDWAMGPPAPGINPDRFSVRWTGRLIPSASHEYLLAATTDDGVRVYLDGALVLDKWIERSATTDYVPVRLEAGRAYDLRVEYYENSGYSLAALGWDVKPEADAMLQEALTAVQGAQAAVIVVGIIEGEGRDRARLSLPGKQEALIKAVADTGVPVVVVLNGGSAVTMESWGPVVPAILEQWYGGEEGGNALADVLFGLVNPAGRLPITFPQFEGQTPLYHNPRPTGRGTDYVDMSGRPLYPFGYGLSYTEFEYQNLRVTPSAVALDGRVAVSVEVKNAGDRAGEEVVQLYLRDTVSSVSRPIQELRGLQRISLEPGEVKTVGFILGTEALSFLDKSLKSVVEPGTFEVMIGGSSADIRAKAFFEVVR
jgi:beta-glucosidase